PSSLAFGVQSVTTDSPSRQLILSNSQSVPLTISGIAFGGTNPLSFTQTNDCGSSLAAGGGTCSINVSFTPVVSGALSATLSVTDSATNSPQTVSLTGTATNLPTLSFSTASVNFGNQDSGTTSAAFPITVTNTGATAVSFSGIAVTGTNSSSFPESNNCPTSLAAGIGCTIYVSFAPGTTGSFSAAVMLSSNAYGSPQSLSLSGTGVLAVSLSSTSITFGSVLTGSSKAAAAIKLTNQMSVALTGINVASSGAPFSQVNTCGATLAAGNHCTITVTFAPTVSGVQTGTISITDSAPTSPQTIALKGSGLFPINVSSSSLYFGAVTVGTSSAAKDVVVTNNEKVSVSFTSIAITGADAGDFSQTNTCGSSLATTAKCTIAVTFTPAAKGARAASLTLTDSATNSPQTVSLHGTGN
ncbi:MAG: choice-of-anchor D domain-containing protein, partial [Candidatus Sulfotelmatobacter sp.]